MKNILICPVTKKQLFISDDNKFYQSKDGKTRYPIKNDIVRLIDNNDDFYEGTYKNTVKYIPKDEKWFYILPLWAISNGFLWYVRKYVPKHSKVIELGCASGVKYFGKRYDMIGIDISFSSLSGIGDIYNQLIQVDVTEAIPLSDNSTDAVISSYFWEHITLEDKHRILKECYRVLRPGGKLIFLFDVKTDNPLIKLIKSKNPDFYKLAFLDHDGHLGYHTPTENKKIFIENSFNIVVSFGMEKTFLQSPSVYGKLGQLPSVSKYFFRIISNISNTFLKPHLFLLRLVDTIFKNVLPDRWSRIFLLVLTKK